MKAIKYHVKNPHTETCVFEEWKQPEHKMGYCGKPAVNLRSGISARARAVKSILTMRSMLTGATCRKKG